MSVYKVQSPVAGYDGIVAGVQFKDGCGEVDSETQVEAFQYFKRKGYGLVEVVDGKEKVLTEVQAPAEVAPGTSVDADQPPTPSAEAVERSKEAEAREQADDKRDEDGDKKADGADREPDAKPAAGAPARKVAGRAAVKGDSR